MSKIGLPRFSASKLQQVVAKHGKSVKIFSANLDAVSADIKLLEAWLQEHGVCLPFTMEVHNATVLTEPEKMDRSTDFYNGAAQEINEFVSWNKDEQSGKWRVMYTKTIAEGCWECDGGIVVSSNFESPKTIETRPLIECPVEIRLRGYKKLPDLLELICREITVDRVKLPE